MRRILNIVGTVFVLGGVLAFFAWLFREVPPPAPSSTISNQTIKQSNNPAIHQSPNQTIPTSPVVEAVPEPPTAEELAEARAAALVDAFDEALGGFVDRVQNEDRAPDAEGIAAVKRTFDALSSEQREEELMSILMLDDDYLALLEAIVLDPSEPKPVLEALVDDLANRDAARPILEKVAAQSASPVRTLAAGHLAD